MKILAVDVTRSNLYVIVYDGEKFYDFESNEGAKRHNSIIIPAIDDVLERANMKIEDIDVFACVVGPGSFTGIRIGIATIKALAFAMNKKMVSITSFEAYAFDKQDEEFFVTIDARNNNCYAAKYEKSWTNEVVCTYTTYDEIKKTNIKCYKDDLIYDAMNLINVTIKKAADGQFSQLEPLYLRKSQAEREADEKQNN